jgi:hypothetical protein
MQANAVVIEREARRRVPDLLAVLLNDSHIELEQTDRERDTPADLVARDEHGRRWIIEVKSSSRPGQVANAAEQLRAHAGDGLSLLVVPFMSRAGAETADREHLNWLDLSGNARIRAGDLNIWVQGRPDQLKARGRPSSPFAPKSARVTRLLLLDPARWWRQRDLVQETGIDDGNVSRIVARLNDELLLERRGPEIRPRDAGLLLDAWSQDYRFNAHDIIPGHVSGNGMEVARTLSQQLDDVDVHHAFTGLPAAWVIDQFARFRLTSVYVDADPREVADLLELRQPTRGSNVQLVGPNDAGVFAGGQVHDGLPCVSIPQIYLDLQHLPERSAEAAEELRTRHLRFSDATAG